MTEQIDSGWRCPYCEQIATLLDRNLSRASHFFDHGNKHGYLELRTQVIICPNSSCREYIIGATLYHAEKSGPPTHHSQGTQPISHWLLRPQSSAKPWPEYIPRAIRQDYEEACLIRSLSPKASATLSRRCLQGIIRDFWGIQKARLIDEINALKDKIDGQTWQAIDAVRRIGNIGAHMEKDIGVIIDVDPQEADLLIRLIAVLLQEWYIRRHERAQHMQMIVDMAQEKQGARQQGPPQSSQY